MAMDAKDLRTVSALGERVNDGTSKFIQNSAAAPCNKTYQDLSTNPLSKVDAPTSRPCAVIGPDRVLPQPTNSDAYLKKNHYEPWPPLDNTYRQPPEYPHKITSYQSPIRNISPRQTFQENMQRIMVPPTYNSINMNEDTNYMLDRNISQSKNKLNVPYEAKYCDVPYTVNPLSDNQKNAEICVPNINNPRNCPPMWHPGTMNVRPTRPYGASEVFQYPEYANCSGPRPVPISRPQRNSEDASHIYADTYYSEGNVRFKPYPNVKDRYPQARYEYVSNYTNPFHPPQPFPSHNMQKNLPHPPYPQMPIKYLENRMGDPIIDGYPRQQLNYNVPYRNQMIHPTYGPMLPNGLQNKLYPYPPEGPIKNIPSNKLPYDSNKVYIDYENSRNKVFTGPDNYYVNDMGRPHLKSQVLIPNYSSVNMQPMPPHPYYRKENHLPKTYDYPPHFRHMDPSINVNHLTRLSAQFSPTSIAMSPSDSNTSNETAHTQGTSLEDCGYVSQSSVASVRSIESGVTRVAPNDIHRRYNYPFPHMMRTSPLTSKSELHPNSSKDKKGIDVRQFLQSWNEGDEESGGSTKEIVTSDYNDPSKSSSHYESVKSQEQLYVLGLVNVPSEELGKYEHIQKISKLPDNIKGYNNIELLKQFEEAIESSNLTNFNKKPRSYQSHIKKPLSQGTNHSTRPVSPLDVESKISQSVIHKEVGCNFEIKPCSPPMLNVEVATPAQNILGERIIEKVSNPLILKSPLVTNITQNEKMSNNIKHPEHLSIINENLKIHSCKMINTQCSSNDTIDTNKPNYCLQDLESNSGVCLASLPRLDNDIELNFPEVNQQFINANKVDSVIITNELSNTSEIVSNINFNAEIKGETNINSKSDIELDKDFPKLSKYRKNQNFENKETYSNSQCLRTDSVIIKNPDNIKSFDEVHNCLSSIDDVAETKNQSILDPLSINTRARESGQENAINSGETSNDMAIDFSLNKNDNIFPHNSTVTDTDKKSSCEMSVFNINKSSFEQASIIKNYNPVANNYSTICSNIESSVIFQDKFENKTFEKIDEKYNTANKNSFKILNANDLCFSNNDTCEGDGMTAINHVDIKSTQSCGEICNENISLNSNKTINEISELYETQVDTRTTVHLNSTDYEPSLLCANNIHISDFPKNLKKDQNNEEISKRNKSNMSDLKSSSNNNTKSESENHNKIINTQKNKYDVRTSDESINTDLDNMDLKILDDSTYGFVNNTNEAFSVSTIMSMDSQKPCLLKKELFSPWIQKLFFYSEGACYHSLNTKLPTSRSMLIYRDFPKYETNLGHAEMTSSTNLMETKSSDNVSDLTKHDTWFNSSDNEDVMSSEEDNFCQEPNVSDKVYLEVEKYKLFDEKKETIVNLEEKEKRSKTSKLTIISTIQINDQEEFKEIPHEKNILISDENVIEELSIPNTLQVHNQEDIINTSDEDKAENDTLNEIEEILNYDIPLIENKKAMEITSDEKKSKNNTYHETDKTDEYSKSLTEGQKELENTSDKNKLPNDNQTEIDKILEYNKSQIESHPEINNASDKKKPQNNEEMNITSDENKLLNDHRKEIQNILEYDQPLILKQEEITYTSDVKQLPSYNQIEIKQILDHSKQPIENQGEIKNKSNGNQNDNQNEIIITLEHNKHKIESLKTMDNKCAEKLLNDNQNEIDIIVEHDNQLTETHKEMYNKLEEKKPTNDNQNKTEKIIKHNKQQIESQEEMFNKFEEKKPTNYNQSEIERIVEHNKQQINSQEEMFNKFEEKKPTNVNQIEIERIVEHNKQQIESQEECFNKLGEKERTNDNQIEIKRKVEYNKQQIVSQEEMFNKFVEMKPTNDNQIVIERIVEHNKHHIKRQEETFNKLEEKKPTNDNQIEIERIVEHNKQQIESEDSFFNKFVEMKPTNDNQIEIERLVEQNKQQIQSHEEMYNKFEEKKPTTDIQNKIEMFNISEENKPTNGNQNEIEIIVEHNKQSIESHEEVFNKLEEKKPSECNENEIVKIVAHNKQPIESQAEMDIKPENTIRPDENPKSIDKESEHNKYPIVIQEKTENIINHNKQHFSFHDELKEDSLYETKLQEIKDITKPQNNIKLSDSYQVTMDIQEAIESKVDVIKLQSFDDYEYADITATKKISLKRSLSESAIDLLDTSDIHNFSYDQLEHGSNLRKKRRKHFLTNAQCDRAINSVQNNRRKSISSTYNEENLSFCIVFDDNCIITEENEEDKICYAELPESCLNDVNNRSTDEENLKFPTQIILCQQEDSCTYPEPFVLEIAENKPFEESWIDDVACVETVVSDDIAEDITLSAPSSPKDLEDSDNEDSDILNNLSEHTEKVKYIYGDKMCNDDVELLETLFRTPQMNVNKTLTSRESHENDCDRSERNNFLQRTNSPNTDTFHSEHINTNSTAFSNSLEKTVEHAVHLLSENINASVYDQEHGQVSYLSSNSVVTYTNTQDDTVNSCESSVDDVFSYGQETDSVNYNASSSPEVSSTTSEEKNSTILLKITNYKGMRKSQLNDVILDKKNNTFSKSCKFTENINYTNYPNSSKPRPLITKAAQKYIPPAKLPIEDLKVKLVLPQQSLLKLKQLKKSKTKPNQDICQTKDIPKKIKPRFEDVLKSIDEIQIKMHKEKSKKPKKSVPKVVIKKNGNGSHYASTSDKDSFNPDLTGRKWQPWVFIEKNCFIDRMALKKKSKAIFNHRKNTYVFADKFKKYKSISNTKFVISQPKSDESSVGHLKYTIRLKHAY